MVIEALPPDRRAFATADRAIDPFPPGAPRYRPLRTDRAPPLPRIIVTVVGGAGAARRIHFDQREVSVGSDSEADVMLDDAQIAPTHLRLVVDAQRNRIVVVPSSYAPTALDGAPMTRPAPISYRSRIAIGAHELRAALLLPRE